MSIVIAVVVGLVVGGGLGYAFRGAENKALHQLGDEAKSALGSVEKHL